MAYRQLPGQADGPSREPERVQPVPEHYEGVNFPYRGTEQHGVAAPEGAQYDTREFAYPEETAEIPEPALPEPDPVLVKVVNNSAREITDWRPIQIPVTDKPVRILGKHDRRRAVRIRVGSGVASGGFTDDKPEVDTLTTQANLTASGNSAETVIKGSGWTSLLAALEITSLTGTTPNATVKIQHTIDGTNWVDLVSFTAATGAAYEMKSVNGPASTRLRVVWTLTGTITDFDFNVKVMRFPVDTSSQTDTVNDSDIFLINSDSGKSYTGYRVPVGTEVYPFVSTEDVWAVCESGKTSTVYVMAEVAVEI